MQTDFQKRIERMTQGLYRCMNLMLDGMERRAAEQAAIDEAGRKPTLTAIEAAPWRWTNDQCGNWRSCAKPACRRAKGCRGEPRACLDRHLPQVPPDQRKRVIAQLRPTFSLSAAPSTTPPPGTLHRSLRRAARASCGCASGRSRAREKSPAARRPEPADTWRQQ
jgi:hypothetical protein